MNVGQGKEWLEHVGEKLFADPAEGEAGQGHAELGRRKIGVEMSTDMLDEICLEIPLLYQGVKLAATNFDDGKLASDEEPIQRNQRRDGCQFHQQQSG